MLNQKYDRRVRVAAIFWHTHTHTHARLFAAKIFDRQRLRAASFRVFGYVFEKSQPFVGRLQFGGRAVLPSAETCSRSLTRRSSQVSAAASPMLLLRSGQGHLAAVRLWHCRGSTTQRVSVYMEGLWEVGRQTDGGKNCILFSLRRVRFLLHLPPISSLWPYSDTLRQPSTVFSLR